MTKILKANTALKAITGILFILTGALYLAEPLISLDIPTWMFALATSALSLVYLIFICASKADLRYIGGRGVNIAIAIIQIIIGLLIFAEGRYFDDMLAYLSAAWLIIIAVLKFVQSAKIKKDARNGWYVPLVAGIFFIVIAALTALLQWLSYDNMIGASIGAGLAVYGVVLLCEGLLKPRESDLEEDAAQNTVYDIRPDDIESTEQKEMEEYAQQPQEAPINDEAPFVSEAPKAANTEDGGARRQLFDADDNK